MKRTFWDVLLDCNKYRLFAHDLDAEGPARSLEFNEMLKTTRQFGENWHPLRLELWEGEPGKRKKEERKPNADFMGTGLLLDAISGRAKSLLESLIVNQVEFLLLETPVRPYYGLHVKYVDCLDAKHSAVVRFKSSGRIMEVEKYAFHWDRLEGVNIFRLPELGLSRLFVSDEFKRIVEDNGLTGLEFYPIPLVED